MSLQLVGSSSTAWRDLEDSCDAAIRLSREVASHIQEGSRAGDYLPLLRRQLALADEVRDEIARLGGLGPTAGDGDRRQRLVGRLVELLDLEQCNQSLLTHRGARISHGTRPPRPSVGAGRRGATT
ncbi:hypothetical protein ACFL6X_05135 [Candidatus Latescibacterota bacterium]